MSHVVPDSLLQLPKVRHGSHVPGSHLGLELSQLSALDEYPPSEKHSRISFNRRGQVAFAKTAGTPLAGIGDLFITTAEARGFDRDAYVIFGGVRDGTIFNLLRVTEPHNGESGIVDVSEGDFMVTITEAVVIEDPFENDYPQISDPVWSEVKMEGMYKPPEILKKKKSRKAVNDKSLLSFGENEEDGGEDDWAAKKRGMQKRKKLQGVRESVLSPAAPVETIAAPDESTKGPVGTEGESTRVLERVEEAQPVTVLPDPLTPFTSASKLAESSAPSADTAKLQKKKKKRKEKKVSALEAMRAQYKSKAVAKADSSAGKRKRDADTFERMMNFKKSVKSVVKSKPEAVAYNGQVLLDDDDNGGDAASDWKSTEFHCVKHQDIEARFK